MRAVPRGLGTGPGGLAGGDSVRHQDARERALERRAGAVEVDLVTSAVALPRTGDLPIGTLWIARSSFSGAGGAGGGGFLNWALTSSA